MIKWKEKKKLLALNLIAVPAIHKPYLLLHLIFQNNFMMDKMQKLRKIIVEFFLF